MDSTQTQIPTSTSRPISIKVAARKLPIKRKTPTSINPNPQYSDTISAATADRHNAETPPFKYHWIWTEADEIRFLQGLVDCYDDGLVFPRDLFLFYERFSRSMSQPYTKSQLGEKLRRLKKKFKETSDRLGRGGVEFLVLSAHDQALLELSKRLWGSDCRHTSPFGKSSNLFNDNVDVKNMTIGSDNDNASVVNESDLVGMIKDNIAPALPLDLCSLNDIHSSFDEPMRDSIHYDVGGDAIENCGDGFVRDFNDDHDQLNEVKGEDDFGEPRGDISDGDAMCKSAAKLIVDVFDDALKEVGATHFDETNSGSSSKPVGGCSKVKCLDFEKRWRAQRVAELDVLASRWRLIIENYFQGQRY